jgi:Ni/Fe-hydrogenase subunit HybB-like protein
MSHGSTVLIDVNQVIDHPPLKAGAGSTLFIWSAITIGVIAIFYGLVALDVKHFWSSYFVCMTFFMGLSCGGVALTAIFQIVRAKWPSPISRIAEANAAYLPFAYILWIVTYFGKEALYPWANKPLPGREFWMQENFAFFRFAILLAFLFFMMRRFVLMNLRGDIGLLQERAKNKEQWSDLGHESLTAGWQGSKIEVPALQQKRSWNAPLLILLYAVIYSLYAFELFMSMDAIWFSNMFGAWQFIGNIFLAWAVLGMTTYHMMNNNPEYSKLVHQDQFWDMGKLTFAFCMLWGYMFWSQFLPQWYGNLPEETQWLYLRTREFPWKGFAWVVFTLCFIMPFILLVGKDIKRVPRYFVKVAAIIFVGIFLEKYILVIPQFSPNHIPFGLFDIGLFLGFLGVYLWSVKNFLSRYPSVPVAHPATAGKTDW